MLLLLKKEKQQISLWLKISFHKENQKCDRQMLIYEINLEKSLSFDGNLKKVNKLGWFGASTKLFSFLLKKLRIDQINDQSGF